MILEKDGTPLAGVMDIDEFEDYLELRDPKVRAHIAESRKEFEAGKSRPIEQFLQELDSGDALNGRSGHRRVPDP